MDPSFRGRTPNVPYSNRTQGRFHISPRMLLVGGLLLAGVIAATILLSSSGDKSGSLQLRLAARLATLEKMTVQGDQYIKEGSLREFNGRLRIQIASDQKGLSAAYTAKKSDPGITANEADKASFDALKDAQLNSRFDAAYRKLIAQKLDSTTLLIKELHSKTLSKSLKDALNAAYNNFKQLETQLTTPAS